MQQVQEKVESAAAEDVGNIIGLEHVNVTVTDQTLASLFYLSALGMTRDPYMMVSGRNMWVNVGDQQFHLPTRPEAQVIPGHIALVVTDLAALQERLKAAEEELKGTRFSWRAENGHVVATCPWGNQFRCYAPGAEFGTMTLGLPYVEFLVKPGAAAGIARFYHQVLGAPSEVSKGKDGDVARVHIGIHQALVFRETRQQLPLYDGHHVQVYVANFSGPYHFFKERGIIMEEMARHQFRFKEIVDPKTGEKLHTLEHEVRSLRHAMYMRPLVNRDPTQNIRAYVRGKDAVATR